MALQLSGKEFEEIKDGFKEIDKDISGAISRSELSDFLLDCKEDAKGDHVDFYMKVYDVDRNGFIEFPEFLEVVAYFLYNKKPNNIAIRGIFRALDKDNKGLVSVDDLRRFHQMFSHDELLDGNKLDELITVLDTDGDGNINYSEFLKNYEKFESQCSKIRT